MNSDISLCAACPSRCDRIKECARHRSHHPIQDYPVLIGDFSSVQPDIKCEMFKGMPCK